MTTTRPKRGEMPRPSGNRAVALALSHPLRVRIIAAMHSPERVFSPKELADQMGLPVENIAYHVRELRSFGFVTEVDSAPRRGSVEHYFAPTKRAEAWDMEWRSLPAAIKQNLAANALRFAVESIGAAIDGGTFEARDDGVLAQDTFFTDEEGAVEALAILTKTLDDLIEVAEKAKERLGEKQEDGFLLSYVLSGFEGALRPI
jgi:predicted ArsR family transcriptional regulator